MTSEQGASLILPCRDANGYDLALCAPGRQALSIPRRMLAKTKAEMGTAV